MHNNSFVVHFFIILQPILKTQFIYGIILVAQRLVHYY